MFFFFFLYRGVCVHHFTLVWGGAASDRVQRGCGGWILPVGGVCPPLLLRLFTLIVLRIIIVNDSLMTYLLLLTDDLSNPWYTHVFIDYYFKKRISVSIAYHTIFQYL